MDELVTLAPDVELDEEEGDFASASSTADEEEQESWNGDDVQPDDEIYIDERFGRVTVADNRQAGRSAPGTRVSGPSPGNGASGSRSNQNRARPESGGMDSHGAAKDAATRRTTQQGSRHHTANRRERMRLPTVKLGTYDGTTPLETFLAKFNNSRDFYEWDEREQLYHLRACLEADAAQILWDSEEQSTADEVIRLLRGRFGGQDQRERYRAELKTVKRRKGDSLQAVFQEIRRLMALAYPGQRGEMWETIAKDSFLAALGDDDLRLRVLERDIPTLEETLKFACRMEAIGRPTTTAQQEWTDHAPRKERMARTAGSRPGGSTDGVQEKMEQLTEMYQSCRRELDAYRSDLESCRKELNHSQEENRRWRQRAEATTVPHPTQRQPVPSTSATTATGMAAQPECSADNGRTREGRQPERDEGRRNDAPAWRTRKPLVCYFCKEPNHRVKDCPQLASRANGVDSDGGPTETYVDINVCGKHCHALLDTGCERSLIPRKLVPSARLGRTELSVFAANGTKIPVLGTVRLAFTISNVSLFADFLVTETVEEIMLGIDWLTKNGCQWDFVEKTVKVRGRVIPLRSRPSRASVRRVYVSEAITLQPNTQVVVPVRLTINSLRVPKGDWVVEPRQFKRGVFSARTLLPADRAYAAVGFVNATPYPCKLAAGQIVGSACPTTVSEAECRAPEVRSHQTQDARATTPGTGSDESATAPGQATHRQPRDIGAATDRGNVGGGPPTSDPPDAGERDYLGPVYDRLPAELSGDERRLAEQFILEHRHAFSKHEYDLGRTYLIPHRIDTGNNRPFHQPLRRHPRVHEEYIDRKVEEMIAQDIIEPAASPWASNVCLAKKADGGLRFCLDYRQLNELTCKVSYPLPRISSCLDALGGCRYFSTLDLRSGFWQTAMDPADADKTAFITRKGQFRFKVLSFGLVNAPSLFQRIMDLVMAGLSWDTCLVYVDDVIVMSPTFEQHVERLKTVFQRLETAGLKLRPDKCHLFQRRVSFLGHVVSENGLEPDPEKVSAIVNWPVPTQLSDLRSWLGMASYYRSFIKDLSVIAAPLFALTKKGARFVWTELCQSAFESIKNRLTSAPVLASPRDGGGYVIDCDASDHGLGAVLQQEIDGELRVIAYASRTLSTAERSYCTTRKEQLAMVYALKQFRSYVLAHHTVIRSDHAALAYLKSAKEPVGQQARWLDFIEQFDLEIKYRRGASHANADALSRRPCEGVSGRCKQCAGPAGRSGNPACSVEEGARVAGVTTRQRAREQRARDLPGGQPPVVEQTESLPPTAGSADLNDIDHCWSKEELHRMQMADEGIAAVLKWMDEGRKPTRDEIVPHGREVKTYLDQWESLVVQDSVLYRRFERPEGGVLFLQLVVPGNMRCALITKVHAEAAAHLGRKKTVEQVQRRAYWPSWRSDVERAVRRCAPCNQYHRGKLPRKGPLQDMRVGGPFERLQVDLTGPHVSVNGFQYICTVIDPFTKYVVAWPIRDKRAVTVARGLVERVFLPFGASTTLLTDNGKEFQNELLQEVCRLLGVDQRHTTAYHPACNGAAERWHRTLNAMMGKTVSEDQRDWPQRVAPLVSAYNATVHEATGYSPNFLMFGRELNVAVDVALGNPSGPVQSTDDYAEQVVGRIQDAYRTVRDALGRAAERNRNYYDAKVREEGFQPGNLV